MPHVSKSIDVDVPPEHLLAVLQAYGRYPEFIPEIQAIRVEPRPDGRTWVTYKLDAKLMPIDYTLEHWLAAPLRLEWRLVRGDFFRANSGSWSLEPQDGGTRATYAIDLLLGKMPDSLSRALQETGLPRLLGHFKSRAEALWKARKS